MRPWMSRTHFSANHGALHLCQSLCFRDQGSRVPQIKIAPGQYSQEVLMCLFARHGA